MRTLARTLALAAGLALAGLTAGCDGVFDVDPCPAVCTTLADCGLPSPGCRLLCDRDPGPFAEAVACMAHLAGVCDDGAFADCLAENAIELPIRLGGGGGGDPAIARSPEPEPEPVDCADICADLRGCFGLAVEPECEAECAAAEPDAQRRMAEATAAAVDSGCSLLAYLGAL